MKSSLEDATTQSVYYCTGTVRVVLYDRSQRGVASTQLG